jgi:hypothetical protein
MNIYLKNLYKSKIWEAVVIILALFSIYSLLIILPYRTNENDFAHYYVSSRLLLEGKNPYSTPMKPLYDQYGLHFDEAIPFATNPPLLLLLFLPFTIFSPKSHICYG